MTKRRICSVWRTKGPWNFVWKVGVLAWGLGEAVVFTPLFAWLSGAPFWPVLGLALILFPVGGIVVGYGLWLLNEWLHRRAKAAGNS